MKAFAAMLMTLALCACATPQKIAEVRNYNATFACGETLVMKVSFTPFAAVLESDGVSTGLTQQPSADGLFYAGGGQTLRAHGPEAIWTDGKGAAHRCQERPAQALH